ncbi:hypothetical protein [Pantoea sp. SoEX]|uniref:hypothetical protein n=1 Tax=Pantoea sp. SoEX TaxID=2576763 RepID=UPI00135C8917|nr:hypothetical protein [Pantoea sp. SoEX]MXP50935.1 hypothetical protein [Pantoea sp. SoEX]
MHITAISVYRESKKFFLNKLVILIFITLMIAAANNIIINTLTYFSTEESIFSKQENTNSLSSLNLINDKEKNIK